jgi:hypothetical protein
MFNEFLFFRFLLTVTLVIGAIYLINQQFELANALFSKIEAATAAIR